MYRNRTRRGLPLQGVKMKRTRLIWQIFPAFLAIILLALLAVSWTASIYLRELYREQITISLTARAKMARELVKEQVINSNLINIDKICKDIGSQTSTRITVISPTGQVLGDSQENPREMENHASREEFRQALTGEKGISTRFSATLRQEMIYVALPLTDNDRTIAVIRTSLPNDAVENTLWTINLAIFRMGIIIALIAAMLSLLISQALTRPLQHLQRGAESFSHGQLSLKLRASSSIEMHNLAEAMNQMAEQLDKRLRLITRQRNELESVFAGMSEGVLATDKEQRVIKINHAAATLLETNELTAPGKHLHEVIRNNELHDFLKNTFTTPDHTEGQITLHLAGRERTIQVYGSPLRDEHHNITGSLIVFNDITQLRQLENIRKDFVANVSHELKTPITSIKGFAETLIDGALKKPEDAQRFVNIIARQSSRLEAIIDDLLTISRIEQNNDSDTLLIKDAPLNPVISASIQLCQPAAQAKNIKIERINGTDPIIPMNSRLLEQAFVNLIDNAVKYSPNDTTVTITSEATDTHVAISITDQGPGIPPEHLPRLFERFYRVDKARSRNLGGTGLGLSIVKHITNLHKGTVSVKSRPNHGSTFTLKIPRENPNPQD